jgi:hypothetical protein
MMARHSALRSKNPHRYTGHSFGTIPDQMCDTMHRSKDDEERERDIERERRQNVSLHECMHIHLVMVPHGNFYKLCHTTLRNFWTKGRLNSQPRRPAAGRTEDAAQAALPPDKHKAVRWEVGTRRKPAQPRPRSGKREHEHGEVAEMPCGSQG